ncbi:unnamed protein product [Ilex paraguariensis]|uniref:Cyclin-dependent protein kinase inhibitor SMR9 n=1 Tax=Ilex paraguariensis TaxID=185542 RepID=A0ABC8T5K5_9AQUA
MAPSGRRRTRTRSARKPRKSHFKKRLNPSENGEISVVSPSKSSAKSSESSSTIDFIDLNGADVPTSACSTPKAERFRIPEIQTCPPAPKKRRVVSSCSLQRTPIAFFAPPDLELFFFFALQDIPV